MTPERNEPTSKSLFSDLACQIQPERTLSLAGDAHDAADEAMSDSFRVSFRILKIVMLVVLVAFLFSGVFWVDQGRVAILLRFGKVVGRPGSEVIEPGGPHFALPAPIDEVVYVPTTLQEATVGEAFWYQRGTESDDLTSTERRRIVRALLPGTDGSLLTGDRNVVHGKWTVTYQVRYDPRSTAGTRAPLDFAVNVGSLDHAERIVRNAAEKAILEVVAGTSVDRFRAGDIANDRIAQRTQDVLDTLSSGLTVVTVSQKSLSVPLAVEEDFQAVTKAESEKALAIEDAKRFRSQTLNQVAGTRYPAVLAAIDAYEQARAGTDRTAVQQAETRLSELLVSPEVGGQVAAMINAAKIVRTRVVQVVRGASVRFKRLVELHDANPGIVRNRMLQDTLQKVFTGNVRTFYLPQGDKTIYLEVDGTGDRIFTVPSLDR